MSNNNSREKYPQQRSCSSSSLSPPPPSNNQDNSSSFLKIPRIRLKQKSQNKSSPPQQTSHHQQDSLKSKFSYIENSHLVNPVMIQQQQQKIVMQNKIYDGGDGDSLIKPKKLPNPIKESQSHSQIHRELLLNQKIGRSVLNHKSELQKALEKLATKSVDSDETEKHHPGPNPPILPASLPHHPHVPVNKNEFQRILDARAKQIEEQKCFVDGVTKHPVISESEFEKIHKRIAGGVQQK